MPSKRHYGTIPALARFAAMCSGVNNTPGVFGNDCPCSPRPAISRPHGVRDPAKPEVHTHPVSSVGGSQVEEDTARQDSGDQCQGRMRLCLPCP